MSFVIGAGASDSAPAAGGDEAAAAAPAPSDAVRKAWVAVRWVDYLACAGTAVMSALPVAVECPHRKA
ncbi:MULTISPECIES: hypothetical protein [unclassified Streptomyces]|uniref:MFS transporter n=1 Tax=Streptomyces sp. NBC_00119 TaxID=2975659 RepID=A0AAU1TZY2_9ACTN|nr:MULTISPECIES: hypothetical protein [unclassified Streptomyces]MCX4648185.1 hypothetical protein [Streptomyces sp. NBC_01446]MCX5323702.1 hypothetical protein [Streptomyces sp. NBC_00120]